MRLLTKHLLSELLGLLGEIPSGKSLLDLLSQAGILEILGCKLPADLSHNLKKARFWA